MGQGNALTVLLVDDVVEVRRIIAEMLQTGGFQVLEAASGSEALQVSNAHPGDIDLLLTDLIMPGMTGRMLADRLVLTRPGLSVVFISGYVDDSRSDAAEPGLYYIQKPVTAEKLLEKISEALAERSKKR